MLVVKIKVTSYFNIFLIKGFTIHLTLILLFWTCLHFFFRYYWTTQLSKGWYCSLLPSVQYIFQLYFPFKFLAEITLPIFYWSHHCWLLSAMSSTSQMPQSGRSFHLSQKTNFWKLNSISFWNNKNIAPTHYILQCETVKMLLLLKAQRGKVNILHWGCD